jgi:hypothetical protein
MPPPPTTIPSLDAPAFECMEQLDEVRTALVVVNMHALSRAPTTRDFDYIARASAYVWVAAALEEFTKRFVEALITEINEAVLTRKELRPSLLALDNARSFQALQALAHPRDLKKWSFQLFVLESVDSSDAAKLSLQEEHWPMDGSTLHTAHLDTIWQVFGLTPPSVPSPRTNGFLKDLRDNRTRAAHGEESAVRLGRQRSAQDSLHLIRGAEDLVSHMLDRGTSYLLGGKYRR